MTQSPLNSNTPTGNAAELQRLGGLHRMSRTAGLGSSDYSAVNTASVVTLLIGGASGLALLSPIFLVLPVVGVVVGIIALRQVLSSGGTQSGATLAIIGLLFALGFSGFTGVKAVRAAQTVANDENELKALVSNFGKALSENRVADAYEMTDPRFREQVPMERFKKFFDDLTGNEFVGPVKSIESNGLFAIETDPETDFRMAMGLSLMKTAKTSDDRPMRPEVRYRRSGDQWRIIALPEWFPPSQNPGAPAPQG